jgi:hypothetical protein
MMWHKRSAHLDFRGDPRSVGALDLRAPEDLFSADDQVRGRYRWHVKAPEIETAISSFTDAWDAGDEQGARLAATELVNQTRAHFQKQGVPVFAHPVVPPQFVAANARVIDALPSEDRPGVIKDLLEAFDDRGARAGVERQFASLLVSANAAPTRGLAREVPMNFAQEPTAQQGARRDAGQRQPSQPKSGAPASEPKKPRQDYAPFESESQSEDLTSGERQRPSEADERIGDYNDGNVAEVVNGAIADSDTLERLSGQAGTKVRNKGRYVWTRYGWVDLQHVVSAATSANDPFVNFVLGLGFEGIQAFGGQGKYWSSFMKKEDLLSNWIGARALWHQKRYGGTIGYWVARLLKEYRPVSRKEAAKFLALGGKAEKWPYDDLGF